MDELVQLRLLFPVIFSRLSHTVLCVLEYMHARTQKHDADPHVFPGVVHVCMHIQS